MICYKLLLPYYFNLHFNVYLNFLKMSQLYQMLITLQFENHTKQRANYVFPITRCIHTLRLSKILIFYFYSDVSYLSHCDLMLCVVRLQLQYFSTQRTTNCLGPLVFCYLNLPIVSIHTPMDLLNSKFLFCGHCVLLCSFCTYSLFPFTYIISLCFKINCSISIMYFIVIILRNVRV